MSEFTAISFLTGYILLGLLSGVSAGLLGVGGGLVIVPGLLLLFRLQGLDETLVAHSAIGTSLAIIIPISLSSMRAHQRRGAVIWPWVRQLSPGLLVGALAGALLADQMNTLWLQRLFGIFTLLVAIRLLGVPRLSSSQKTGHKSPSGGWWMASGGLIGMISGMVGIGGGTMTVPLLAWLGTPVKKAIGTSAACGLPIALAGAIGFSLTGIDQVVLGSLDSSPLRLGYVDGWATLIVGAAAVGTAPLGAFLTHRLPVVVLTRLFAMVLMLVGTKLLLT